MATVSISDLLTQRVRINPRDVTPADWVTVISQLLENAQFEHFLGFKTLEQHLLTGFGDCAGCTVYPSLLEVTQGAYPRLRLAEAEFLPVAVIQVLPYKEEWKKLKLKDGSVVYERRLLMSRAGELLSVRIHWLIEQVLAKAVVRREGAGYLATKMWLDEQGGEKLLHILEQEKREYEKEEPPFAWIGYQILMSLMGAATTTRDKLKRHADEAERYGDRVAGAVSLFGHYAITRLADLPPLPRLVIRQRR